MLSPSQMILYTYIISRVKKDRRDEAKKLINEGFSLEKKGNLSKEYLLSMKAKYIDLAKPEAVPELTKAIDDYISSL